MAKTGIFYSFNSNKTRLVADKLVAEFGEGQIERVNVEELTGEEFLGFDFYILGVPTWFDGELPNYWDEFVPALEELDLTGRTFAIYGLGDQVGYPENFGDGIGLMADIIESCGGKLIGSTSCDDYKFESSKALRDGKFIGLVIDQENQARLTKKRIKDWVEELNKVIKK